MSNWSILGEQSPGDFLKHYWQKQILHISQAMVHFPCPITANDLAGMACETDNCKLIQGSREKQNWSCQFGPFSEKDFQTLPEQDWTLLVQEVEHFEPRFQELFAALPFIPGWRKDDIMVSYAPPGGSVGPHQDRYDVFLIQLQGTRLWQIDSNCNPELDERFDSVQILKHFHADQTVECKAGDVLYIPPGVGHWGTAVDDCLTASVGLYAPTLFEMISVLEVDGYFKESELLYQDPNRPLLTDVEEQRRWEADHIRKLMHELIDKVSDEKWLEAFTGLK